MRIINKKAPKEEKEEFAQESFSYLGNDDRPSKPQKNYHEKEKKYTSWFTYAGHIFAVGTIIMSILYIFIADIGTVINFIFSSIFTCGCIYGLGNARERIKMLEDKQTKQEKDIEELKNRVNTLYNSKDNKE